MFCRSRDLTQTRHYDAHSAQLVDTSARAILVNKCDVHAGDSIRESGKCPCYSTGDGIQKSGLCGFQRCVDRDFHETFSLVDQCDLVETETGTLHKHAIAFGLEYKLFNFEPDLPAGDFPLNPVADAIS